MTVSIAAPVKTLTFPAAEIEACLTQELVEAIKADAEFKGYTVPATPAAIVKAAVQVDSIITVSILCSVEPLVGFELPDDVVKTGGYGSIEAAVAHMLPRIQKLWAKKHGVKA